MKKLNYLKSFNVTNMKSSRGNEVPNQFIITTNKGYLFQSYKANIAFIDTDNNLYLDEYYWDYSRTTSKYLYQFIKEFKGVSCFGINKKKILELIKENEVKEVNLN